MKRCERCRKPNALKWRKHCFNCLVILGKRRKKQAEKEAIKRRKAKQVKPVPVKTPRFRDIHPELYDKQLIKQLRDTLISLYGEVCMCCGSTEKIVLEHIKSRAIGGTNELSNLQLLCFACNFKKGHKQTDYRPER